MAEQWRDIPGYEGLYQASLSGLIRSCDRVEHIKNRWGSCSRLKKARVLKPNRVRGYDRVVLCDESGQKPHSVHRLVCRTWHGSAPFEHAVVAHNDGNPRNNTAENLRWSSQSDNIADMRSHGTLRQGSDLWHVSKLTRDDVLAIRAAQMPAGALARQFGVSDTTIRAILARKTWKHV